MTLIFLRFLVGKEYTVIASTTLGMQSRRIVCGCIATALSMLATDSFAYSPADGSMSAVPSGAYKIVGKVTLSAGRKCQFAQGVPVAGVLDYPGAGTSGAVLFLGSPADTKRPVLRLVTRFPAVPATGLNSWTIARPAGVMALAYSNRQQVGGEMKGGVSFALTLTATSPETTLRGRIRVSDSSGCTQSYDATLTRFGHFVAVSD